MRYRQGHPDPTQREILFKMIRSDGTPDTGLAFTAGDLQIRRARALGGAANSSNWVNVDATQLAAVWELTGSTSAAGSYIYTATVAEMSIPGPFIFKAKKGTGILFEEPHQIDRAYFLTVQGSASTTTSIVCDRGESSANHWNNALAVAIGGALDGQFIKIAVGGLAPGSPATLTAAAGYALSAAPAAGAIFELVNR